MAEKLKPPNAAWAVRLDTYNPSRGINFSLIKFPIAHLDYPDKARAKNLSKCTPLVGNFRPTQVSPIRERPVRDGYQVWKDVLPARNRRMVERATKSANAEESRLRLGEHRRKPRLDGCHHPRQ